MSDKSFKHSKAFGQNFLTDINLLAAIVRDAGVSRDDTVIEVGAGAGALTSELIKAAGRVIAFEIDHRLEPTLLDKFKGADNLDLVFADIMKADMPALIEKTGGEYKLVANLPYYITTPVLFRFIESGCIPSVITVMVQKEVAERLTAQPSTKDYGALTVSVQSLYDVKISRNVNRKLFTPVPNVDSAVVVMRKKEDKPFDRELFGRLVRSAFAMRRKTLLNNLMQGFNLPRSNLEELITKAGFNANVRGEALSIDNFINLAELIAQSL